MDWLIIGEEVNRAAGDMGAEAMCGKQFMRWVMALITAEKERCYFAGALLALSGFTGTIRRGDLLVLPRGSES